MTPKLLLIVLVFAFGPDGVAATTYSHAFRSEAACLEAARMLERGEEVSTKHGSHLGRILVQADCVEQ